MMMDDTIIAVNNHSLYGELDKWLAYFDDEQKSVTILRGGKLLELTLPEVQRNFYLEYTLKQMENPNGAQKKAFEHWSK